MLVASLQFLSAEFEDQVLVPVTKLKARPVAALRLMVDLYLDPDIASPRKVSVWYAFWGEASSRQEYYDICGQKDESFAALVHELIETLILQTSQPHLDPDGVALGLIGALEILWQDIAFQTERDIDRAAAKRRCLAYLRSIFPGHFTFSEKPPATMPPRAPLAILPRWAYEDSHVWAREREVLFQRAWMVVGHESQLPRTGDFITANLGVERVLLVRGKSGVVRALRNTCPELPHALIADREGHFAAEIHCAVHGLRFSFEGQARGNESRTNLKMMDFDSVGGLFWVRCSRAEQQTGVVAALDVPLGIELASGLMMMGAPKEWSVDADWKVLVEQWLESASIDPVSAAASVSPAWDAPLVNPAGWSARRYLGLMACLPEHTWRRQFIAPHQLLESRPDGLSVLQALPTAPGRALLRRLDYTALPPDDSARASLYLAQRLGRVTRRSMRDMAESVQRGLIDFGYELPEQRAAAPAVAWFRGLMAARVPGLLRERASDDVQTSL